MKLQYKCLTSNRYQTYNLNNDKQQQAIHFIKNKLHPSTFKDQHQTHHIGSTILWWEIKTTLATQKVFKNNLLYATKQTQKDASTTG